MGTTTPRVRVLIADDQALFTEAVDALLSTDGRIEVAGQAHDGREAVEAFRRLKPDVVLMDISMPVLDGIEATRQIRAERERACVLMLTGSSSSVDVDRARQAGAAGYVTKDRISLELADRVFDVASRSLC